MKYLIIGYGHGMTHWIETFESLDAAEQKLSQLNLTPIEGVEYEIERRHE